MKKKRFIKKGKIKKVVRKKGTKLRKAVRRGSKSAKKRKKKIFIKSENLKK